MPRVLALVEGPTERNFGQRLLAAHLEALGIAYCPRVIGKPGRKGGGLEWGRAKRELLGLIRQEPLSVVTTMFDFYALPPSWPGRQEARERGLTRRTAAEFVETRIANDILAQIQNAGSPLNFIPYLSLHEYEALLFSDPQALASVTQGRDHAIRFQNIVDECGGCEEINDNYETAPSKRILQIAPTYDKTVDGITAAARMGLDRIRSRCPHFHGWLLRLEALAQGTQQG